MAHRLVNRREMMLEHHGEGHPKSRKMASTKVDQDRLTDIK